MRDRTDEAIGNRTPRPESLVMGYGYRPELSEGALKSPIFQTSTFVFSSALAGKRFFELAYGLRDPDDGEQMGLIYSRLNNPDLEILEDRLALFEGADTGLAFASGMAAIATTLLSFLRPGDVLLHSAPLYGGTDHLVRVILPEFDIVGVEFRADMDRHEIERLLEEQAPGRRLGMIYVETPANPTNDLIDIEMAAAIAAARAGDDHRPLLVVDNTFLGPLFQHPMRFGADLVVYSATKYLGGHSDLIAGTVVGTTEAVRQVAATRTFLGTMTDPWTGWLLMRSLETLTLRMTRQVETAERIARFLAGHPAVRRVRYLGLLEPGNPQYDLYKRQCLAPGAMVAFEVDGGEAAAFRFLDSLRMVRLAVSLGGTESLAEHPASMTHAGVDPEERERTGVTDGLIRLSVGVEHPDDLVADLSQALETMTRGA